MNWLENPFVWLALFPALASSGLLFQMILGLFSCCATFRLRGKSVQLRWWMIPSTSIVTVMLWISVVFLIFFTSPGG